MKITEIWTEQSNLRNQKIVEAEISALKEGEVLVSIDRFSLTANNVSYATAGHSIGYWNFYPADDGWGKVPVWGYGDVVESRCDGVDVGERFYGFLPMASHAVLRPGSIKPGSFYDVSPYRRDLAAVYNQYQRTAMESDLLKNIENERCLLFPLFITSYLLSDYLTDNGFFDSEQIVIGSVSSKTGFGMAAFLKDTDYTGKIVGLTSDGNVGFVEGLNVCDQVVTYDNVPGLDPKLRTVFVDMSGDGPLAQTLHELYGDNMVQSIAVGATHWDAGRASSEMPGAKPEFFFAPAHIAKRNSELGPGVLLNQANSACAALATRALETVVIETHRAVDDVMQIWRDMLDKKVSPKRGVIVSLPPE